MYCKRKKRRKKKLNKMHVAGWRFLHPPPPPPKSVLFAVSCICSTLTSLCPLQCNNNNINNIDNYDDNNQSLPCFKLFCCCFFHCIHCGRGVPLYSKNYLILYFVFFFFLSFFSLFLNKGYFNNRVFTLTCGIIIPTFALLFQNVLFLFRFFLRFVHINQSDQRQNAIDDKNSVLNKTSKNVSVG